MTLTEFLLARIAEREAVAKAALAALSDLNCQATVAGEFGAHIARHDPERVLARCEADRRIVETHAHCDRYGIPDHHACPSMPRTLAESAIFRDADPCDTLRLLALPDADHPDYRPEWKP